MSTFVPCLLFCTLVVGVVPMEKCVLGNVEEFVNCASVKSLKMLQRAESADVVLAPGITLKATAGPRSPKNLDLDSNIPTNNTAKLLDLFLSRSLRFVSSRTLNIEVPMNVTGVARALEEGRGKMKKMMGPLILGLGAKMMGMVPILFAGVLFLVTKALLVGKVALVLSALLFVHVFISGRGFFNNGGTFSIPPTYGVPTTYGTNFGGGFGGTNSIGGWGTSGGYSRSINVEEGQNR